MLATSLLSQVLLLQIITVYRVKICKLGGKELTFPDSVKDKLPPETPGDVALLTHYFTCIGEN